MAKKKKGTGIGSCNPILDAMTKMLDGLSPEQKLLLMDSLEAYAQSGKDINDIQEISYSYQCPDYDKQVKPLAEYLVPLIKSAKPSDVVAAYEQAHEAMSSLSQQEREDALHNFFMCILADGRKGIFGRGEDASSLPLFAAFRLVDDFHLIGLFDVIQETLRQNPNFLDFYFCGFEDVATLILARVGAGHLEEMKEMMNIDEFSPEIYLIIFNAAILMAVENPTCRLQVLAWVSDVLKSCVEVTIPTIAMDFCVKSLAQIKAVELLPLIKTIYKEYQVPSVEINSGIKGVTQLLTQGTDERIVEFDDFKEFFDELLAGEDNDFDYYGGTDKDWLSGFLEPDVKDWGCEEDECDSDALFYKECDLKPSKAKNKQKYALTLDVSLKGSPRKVYRQLVVPSDLRLDCLGEVLVYAVGWQGYHLNQFLKGNDYYLLPDANGDLDWGYDSREYSIGDLLSRVGSKVVWEYDFGDSWNHEVKLVEKVKVDENTDISVTLAKATGACPPENKFSIAKARKLIKAYMKR